MKSIIFIILIISAACRTAQEDRVYFNIPGYYSQIYSGPIPINTYSQDIIHYMMFASQSNPQEDPLVLWLSGGPGCSSFLATHYQNGPYVFNQKSIVFRLNDYSWNKKANLLYFETPQGVGYSQSSETSFNDQKAALSTYQALLKFFERFPEFNGRSFYLSGSGYAGIYITQLSKLILEGRAEGSDFINLKGALMGNPCIKPQECWPSGSQKKSYYHYQHLYQHNFYTEQTWRYFKKLCTDDYNSYRCFQQRQLMDNMFRVTNTSIYNVNQRCEPEQSFWDFALECQDHQAAGIFLNDLAIKSVFHFPGDHYWQPCNREIFLDYVNTINSYKNLPYLIQNDVRIWVYSGELDSSIPIMGTKKWVEDLRKDLALPVVKKWRTWYTQTQSLQEVGGEILELKGLTFASVRNAGFRAARDRPNAIYTVLEGFLNQRPL